MKFPSPTRQTSSLVIVFLLVASFLPIIVVTSEPVQASPAENSFKVTWNLVQDGIIHKVWEIDIQNFADETRKVKLDVLFEDTSFGIGELNNVQFYEWEAISEEIEVYDYDNVLYENIPIYDNENSLTGYENQWVWEIVSSHFEDRLRCQWGESKMQTFKTENGKWEGDVGEITLPKLGSEVTDDYYGTVETENGTKRFRIEFDVPIVQSTKGWGSSGEVGLIIDNEYHHPWWDSSWQYKMEITIDHTKVDDDLTDFPIAVILNSSNFDFSHARSDGYDIRFTNGAETMELKYERERHDSSGQKAEYHVKIPAVSSSVDTDFYIYFGKSDATDGADPANVWDADFRGVWHLSESAGTLYDSTSHDYDGSFAGTTFVDGQIGKCRDLDGATTSDRLSLNYQAIHNLGDFSLEAWAETSTNTNLTLFSGALSSTYNNRLLFYFGASRVFWPHIANTGYQGSYVMPTDGVLRRLVMVREGSTVRLYVNGSLVDTVATNSTTITVASGGFIIGQEQDSVGGGFAGNQAWCGKTDEIRVSQVCRTAAWIKASYNSGNDTLVSYGSEETGEVGWLSGWDKRKKQTITGTTAGAQTNYQLKLVVHKGTGTDNTTDVYCGGNCLDNFGDIRWTKADGITLVDYWVESIDSGVSAVFWIEIPTIPTGAGTVDIYLYYDKATATSVSSGDSTFDFFDGFPESSIDTSKWTIVNATGWSVAGGELKGTNTSGRIQSISTFSEGVIQEAKVRTISLATNGQMVAGFYISSANSIGFLVHPTNDYYRNNGTWVNLGNVIPEGNVPFLATVNPKTSTSVYMEIKRLDTGVVTWSGTITNTVSSEPIVLGKRYDDLNPGQGYETYWDWIRIRKYADPEPTWGSWGEEEIAVLRKPALISPENEAVLYDTTPTFEWTKGANADNHNLLVDDDSGFSSPAENVWLGPDNESYTPTSGLAFDNYWWKVVATQGSPVENENSSDVWEFEFRSSGWLSGWDRRKKQVITGTTAGVQENYQLNMVVHKGSGTDNITDVFCGGNCRDDFGDIRWTQSDGTTTMDYWIETVVSGDYAEFWVEIPSIPASPGTVGVSIYYNNPSATSLSSGTNTFVLIEDFEDISDWDGDISQSTDYKESGTYSGRVSSSSGFPQTKRIAPYDLTTVKKLMVWVRGWMGSYADGSQLHKFRISTDAIEWTDLWTAHGNVSEQMITADVSEYTGDYYLGFQTHAKGGSKEATFWFDTLQERNYVSPEPTWGAWGGEETPLTIPTATTQAATNVEATATRLNGQISDDGGEACEYRFRYKKSGGEYSYTTWTGSKTTGQTFYEDINELDSDSLYYFNAQAKNSVGESAWGGELNFTTLTVGAPSITVPRVFASVYTKGESGTVWAQVLDTDGAPVNTGATVTITIWEPDGTAYVGNQPMTYVTDSNGIYKYDLTAPSEFGTYLCDVKAAWLTYTAYGSGEFQVASWAEKITSILDNLVAHRSAVESKISDIWGWVDALEAGQTSILSDLTTLKDRVPENLSSSLDAIYGFTDQVEGYVDTLAGGQTTLMTYTDAVEGNQQLILDNIDLLKQGQDIIKGYTDTLEDSQSVIQGYVDEVEFYMGVAAMITDGENLYNYLKGMSGFDVGLVEEYCDNIQNYVDTLEAGQTTIQNYVDTLEADIAKVLQMMVDRHYRVNSSELQEFHVILTDFVGNNVDVDNVVITLEDPNGNVVIDENLMNNIGTGIYYFAFPTSGRPVGTWTTTIKASRSLSPTQTVTYTGVWELMGVEPGVELEVIGYLTVTVLDNETHEPIENAKVELFRAGKIVDSKYARWDGKAFIDITAWGVHELRWTAEGYEDEVMQLDLVVTSEMTFKMIPAVGIVFPLMYLFITVIIGGVLLIMARRVGRRGDKGAGIATLISVFVLPSLLLAVLWLAGVLG